MRTIGIVWMMVFLLAAPGLADTGFKEGVKEIGQGIKEGALEAAKGIREGAEEIGQSFKEKGKEAGQAIKEEAKEVGKGFKEMGKESSKEAKKQGRGKPESVTFQLLRTKTHNKHTSHSANHCGFRPELHGKCKNSYKQE